ncbi:MAG: stage II sporulation protein M, partial [Bacteroidota bacterium]
MRETQFIAQNKEKWERFEQTLRSPERDPEKLRTIFIEVTDDLSYARTFYPNRSVRVYLNGLAQQIYGQLYQNQASKRARFLNFWTDELPALVHEARWAFRLSFAIFLLAFLIGTLSAAMDADFVKVILGDSYVEMTRSNIESGDPMRVYKERDQLGMSLGIAANNLYVAFLTFVMGLFAMLGSVVVLINNGIMVGAFQYFFIQEGLFVESFLTIWTHGTLEISAIVIAGAAGIRMGQGLVFPGTYSRLKSFSLSARRGLKIMVGVTPIFILAALIEGFLTRYTNTPDAIRLLFILMCLLYVLGYFVWYPRIKARVGFQYVTHQYYISPNTSSTIQWNSVKSIGTVFEDTVKLYRQQFSTIFKTALIAAFFYTLAVASLCSDLATALEFPYRIFGTYSMIDQFFINAEIEGLFIVLPLIFAFTYYRLFQTEVATKGTPFPSVFFSTILLGLATYACLYTLNDLAILVLPLSFSALLLWVNVSFLYQRNVFHHFRQGLGLLALSYGKSVGLFLLLSLSSFLFFNIMDT